MTETTELGHRERKRIALKEKADAALKAADIQELHKAFSETLEDGNEVEKILLTSLGIAFDSKGIGNAADIVALRSMRDVALAAIELAKACAKSD